MKNTIIPILAIYCFLLSGCASTHLRVNTVQHASTLPDIYDVQVLNNLARFKSNPYATPHFELPSSGGTDIADTVGFGSPALNAFRTNFGFTAARSGSSAWTLDPVTDPDKLERMKCAFQIAVGHGQDACDDCCAKQSQIISPLDADKTHSPCKDPCMRTACWFECSRSLRDAERSGCIFGEYQGLYVWVPREGKAEFSRLVFDVLRYATKDPAPSTTKKVKLYLDANGSPTQAWLASQIVEGEIPIGDPNVGLRKGASFDVDGDKNTTLGKSSEKAANLINSHAAPVNTLQIQSDFRELEFKQRFTLPGRNR